jgi:predicted nuclease of restriction endonuclease-like (RecB) superfamily
LGTGNQGQVLADMNLALAEYDKLQGFSPRLSWTHYRTLLRIEQRAERLFYEVEAERNGWSQPELERQIHSHLYLRLLKSRDKEGVLALASQGQLVEQPVDVIKHPYVLDFLGLPEARQWHEADLESALIDQLQPFLLELGKGFAFVARQQRIATEYQHFYIDLVFYNYLLKCFVLVDLKLGKLTHQDVGQMDMYVRMYDDLKRSESDNPTVGLILCAERDEVVARYSVLNEATHLFASKYVTVLPSEEELRAEIERETHRLAAIAQDQEAESGKRS